MPPRIVGVDFGLVRVGIAVADPLRIFAAPLGTFGRKEALAKLVEIRDREGLELIVLGWPIQLDGAEGETVDLVRKFERQLEGALRGVRILRMDERYTSKIAQNAIRMSGGKRSKRRKKERVDSAAAAVLLQNYLDSRDNEQRSDRD
jgi:putative Holliday junction resolvase